MFLRTFLLLVAARRDFVCCKLVKKRLEGWRRHRVVPVAKGEMRAKGEASGSISYLSTSLVPAVYVAILKVLR
ncbi:MAG: hypothetical protein EA370_15205 [Wenzhouxiangella sp.]|nr:MAG: hypothetical protein EA370_15205 [Wenzhouxiangella sp.]